MRNFQIVSIITAIYYFNGSTIVKRMRPDLKVPSIRRHNNERRKHFHRFNALWTGDYVYVFTFWKIKHRLMLWAFTQSFEHLNSKISHHSIGSFQCFGTLDFLMTSKTRRNFFRWRFKMALRFRFFHSFLSFFLGHKTQGTLIFLSPHTKKSILSEVTIDWFLRNSD